MPAPPAQLTVEGITVTGCAGPVYGTDIYAGTSNINAAAVHHGIVSIGESKSVQVVRLGPQEAFFGTHRNGVLSNGLDKCDTSFAFINGYERNVTTPSTTPSTPRPSTSGTETVTVTGSNDGTVWGTGIYTSDSNMNAAALHAGVVAQGNTKVVQIIRLPGQASYQGTSRNGVATRDYGAWGASFKFAGVDVDLRPSPSVVQTETVSVTGEAGGRVWGSGVYTGDSSMNAAAVHAGVVSVGQTKTVRIARLPGQASYQGSSRNGVTTLDYGPWSASFKFLDEPAEAPQPASILQGEAVTVKGSNDGTVWGSGVYTSDSNMNAAAMHAGVVASGQTKSVRIVRLPGQPSYQGSARNGVTSKDYGQWSGSFKFI